MALKSIARNHKEQGQGRNKESKKQVMSKS